MEKKKPSILDMMKTFTKEVIEYAKEGAPHVTEGQYNARLRTCKGCPYLKQEVMRCGKCGCMVEHKAKWATSTCPDKRWTPVKNEKTPKVKQHRKRHGKGDTSKTSK